jgi:hypothetical protein
MSDGNHLAIQRCDRVIDLTAPGSGSPRQRILGVGALAGPLDEQDVDSHGRRF